MRWYSDEPACLNKNLDLFSVPIWALEEALEYCLATWDSDFAYHDRQWQKRFHDSSSPRR